MHPPWINSVIVSYPAMNQDSIHVEKGRLEYDKLDDTVFLQYSLEITSLQLAECYSLC